MRVSLAKNLVLKISFDAILSIAIPGRNVRSIMKSEKKKLVEHLKALLDDA